MWPCRKDWFGQEHPAACEICNPKHVHKAGCGHFLWPCLKDYVAKEHPGDCPKCHKHEDGKCGHYFWHGVWNAKAHNPGRCGREKCPDDKKDRGGEKK
jgi:hypothetical protein